ncbi:GNAT superfamily N-acetyltransferase [Catenuloplanes nepalensis]|uniref:GNAT superfamily N-acetyltransferase n=1 Tax=Catenuloplanes nepalensis TaxID=587533 RepID=A0ABT9N0H8_9ACTN|nr:GNAT family N-acetyltransferase [Catenuloplanes nepalensis]MDP9797195.1 GNAT superfamily N-acetyltransferase [Catenuloplanes nepalensis]
MKDVEVRSVRYDEPEARTVMHAALAELAGRYGGTGDDTPMDPAEFTPPGGDFVVAFLGGEPVGGAGWRAHGDEDAELKRMFTSAAVRGRGIGRRVLAAIEESARAQGRRRLILEVGDLQPEAIAMYNACGYDRIENFGFYRDEPGTLSFARDL